jgi:hypothetical protein
MAQGRIADGAHFPIPHCSPHHQTSLLKSASWDWLHPGDHYTRSGVHARLQYHSRSMMETAVGCAASPASNTAVRHPFDTFAFVLRNARSAVFQPPPGRCLVLLANRKGRASAEWESAGVAVAISRRQGSSHGKLWESLGMMKRPLVPMRKCPRDRSVTSVTATELSSTPACWSVGG